MKTVTRYVVDAMDEDENGELVSYYDFEKIQEELGKQDVEIIVLKAKLNQALELCSQLLESHKHGDFTNGISAQGIDQGQVWAIDFEKQMAEKIELLKLDAR